MVYSKLDYCNNATKSTNELLTACSRCVVCISVEIIIAINGCWRLCQVSFAR